MSVVANRYSEALFDIAFEENEVQDIYDNLKLVCETFNDNVDFAEVLSHPEIAIEEKIELIRSVFENINTNVLNLLCVLIEKNRISSLNDIFVDYELYYNEYFNIESAKVYTAVLMTKEQISQLEKTLEKKLNKKVTISNFIDSDVIGGMKIVLGTKVLDITLIAQVENLTVDLRNIQIK